LDLSTERNAARREAAVICFAWFQALPVFLFLHHEATWHQRLLGVAEVVVCDSNKLRSNV